MCFVYKSLIKFSFLKTNVNLLSLGHLCVCMCESVPLPFSFSLSFKEMHYNVFVFIIDCWGFVNIQNIIEFR